MSSNVIEEKIVQFPFDTERTFPSKRDLDFLQSLPLVQMFVTGRSGSMLVHSLLDGHPEILHIPHTFRFFDFIYYALGDLTNLSVEEVVDKFVNYSGIVGIFDSKKSVLLNGRLGNELDIFIKIEKNIFCKVLKSLLYEKKDFDEKYLFYAIHLSFSWCFGVNYLNASIVFHHVHHGEWLFIDQYIYENYNLNFVCNNKLSPGINLLKAEKYLMTIRDPYLSFLSYIEYIYKEQTVSPLDIGFFVERFLKLLIQDWLRHLVLFQNNLKYSLIKLESLKEDNGFLMKKILKKFGIATHVNFDKLTLYDFPWYGDVYTKPMNVIKPNKAKKFIFNMDKVFIYACLGEIPSLYGYKIPFLFKFNFFRKASVFLVKNIPSINLFKNNNFKNAFKYARERGIFLERVLMDSKNDYKKYIENFSQEYVL